MPFPFHPEHYETQLDEKRQRFEALFADQTMPEPEVFRSAPEYYRMRAEFRLWHEGEESWFAMFNPAEPKIPVRVDHFPVGSRLINDLMSKVLDAVHRDPIIRERLFQVEFLTTQEGDALITLLYHRKLDAEWEQRGRYWQEQWGFPVIGRARKQRLVLERDYVTETLTINDQSYRFRQYENSFTQPNAGVCEQMVGWAQRHTENSQGDMLELYCGNGNFSIPLARNFNRALGTEISRVSVHSAQHNIEINQVDNLAIARMSSEDFANAWLGHTESRRLHEWGVASYDFKTLLVDPPRAGLDEDTLKLARQFERIVYVSCNPQTLADNVRALSDEFQIDAAALFDQFPYTHHMEAGLVLRRRQPSSP